MSKYNPQYNEHIYEYRTKKFKRVGVDFEKTYYKEVLKPAADNCKLPVNTFIKHCIEYVVTNKVKF